MPGHILYTSGREDVKYMSVVTVSHVEKFYGNQGNITQALNDISFAVEKQEFTAVMGASGSGKTTLLNVISTIDAVSAGNIEINGNGICELAEFRKKELGFIFQDFNLLDTLTLQENIALPLTLLKKRAEQIDTQVNALAEILQIQDILEKYPYQVSGGQRQRCACARAMIHDPSLILADEPTGALDSKSSRMLLDSMERLNIEYNATIMMVTHDAFTASYAHRILFIKDGKIFNEIVRGESSRKDFFNQIMEVVTLLGGDTSNVL